MEVVTQRSACTKAAASTARIARRAPCTPLQPLILHGSIAALSASVLLTSSLIPSPSYAVGLESVDLPSISPPDFIKDYAANAVASSKSVAEAAEESFQNSPLLKKLLANTAANKDKNKRDLQNKYCYRQAEWGVGDCGGLNFVPGATQNGVQKPPEWLSNLLGVKPDENAAPTPDLEKMLGPLQ